MRQGVTAVLLDVPAALVGAAVSWGGFISLLLLLTSVSEAPDVISETQVVPSIAGGALLGGCVTAYLCTSRTWVTVVIGILMTAFIASTIHPPPVLRASLAALWVLPFVGGALIERAVLSPGLRRLRLFRPDTVYALRIIVAGALFLMGLAGSVAAVSNDFTIWSGAAWLSWTVAGLYVVIVAILLRFGRVLPPKDF